MLQCKEKAIFDRNYVIQHIIIISKMHLNCNCLQAIVKCMGGEYFIGYLRATCKRIKSIFRYVSKQY